MQKQIDTYLRKKPDSAAEARAISRSLGPRGKPRPVDRAEEAAHTMLAHLEIAQQRLAQAVETIKGGLLASKQIRTS